MKATALTRPSSGVAQILHRGRARREIDDLVARPIRARRGREDIGSRLGVQFLALPKESRIAIRSYVLSRS